MEAGGLEQRRGGERQGGVAGRAARRVLDLTVAIAMIALTFPIMLAVAIAIRIESGGPAIFRQRRVGLDGRKFTLLKFRSMRADADPETHREYVAALIGNSSPSTQRGGLYKLAVDERITSVGRVIRKWSIDELPQLFNVIAGDMTLVGPRPVTPYEAAEYPGWYRRRFAVKPGLTGLWQVSGRSERTYEEMITLDIEYVDERSALTDLVILARTPWVVLSRRGVR